MNLMAFIEYLNAVDEILERRYGINSKDVGTDCVARCLATAWTPEECVQWLSEKYELERIDIGPYGGEDA